MLGMRNPFLYLCLLLTSCAQVGSPGGGPKDELGPRVIKSRPLNFATSLRTGRIELTFNEFVSLKSPQSEVLISPPFEQIPSYILKGKTLRITWDEALKENTTYTFNLGKAIVDYHEGNPLDSNLFVFSTGSQLDSGIVAGTVLDAFTGKPLEKASVILYTSMQDSTPALEMPYYYTRTDKDGNFTFQFLRKNNFYLFALEDKNSNYRYDLPNEQLAFSNIAVDAGNDTLRYKLRMFTVAPTRQFIKSISESRPGEIIVVTALPTTPEAFFIKPDTGIWEPYHQVVSASSDTIKFYTSQSSFAQTLFCVLPRDTTADTTRLKRKPADTENANPWKPSLYMRSAKAPYYQPFRLINTKPVITVKPDAHVWIFSAGDTLRRAIRRDSLDATKSVLIIEGMPEEDKQYHILLPDSQFADGNGVFNDSLSIPLRTDSPLNYSALQVKIKEISGMPYILEMLNDKEQPIRRATGTDTLILWDHLSSGNCTLRLIRDENRNGIWDTGKFIPRKQPERVYYYSPGIAFKEGWDQEIEWIIEE
jgi:hypothetical protein